LRPYLSNSRLLIKELFMCSFATAIIIFTNDEAQYLKPFIYIIG
jgi:hypothetical protein